MFELALVDVQESDSKKKYKRLELLLNRAIDISEYKRIQASPKLSKSHKHQLNVHRYRKTVLKRIHEELNKRHNPEETFEVWQTQSTLPEETRDTLTETIVNELDKANDNEASESEDETEKNLNEITSEFDQSSTWTKANFLIRSKGLEVFPHHLDDDSGLRLKFGLKKTHTNHITVLLHLNILRGNWNLAYKLFCLLIRVPDVDIRALWPLGIEILSHLQRQQSKNGEKPIYKDIKFFEWLASFYSTRWHHKSTTTHPSRRFAAPVWRSGSRTHAPLYMTSYLWTMLARRDFSKLNDKLSELLLEPPYSNDGLFYFLLASSKLLEALDLRQQFIDASDIMEKDELRTKIRSLLSVVDKQLMICKEMNFYYPESALRREVDLVMKTLELGEFPPHLRLLDARYEPGYNNDYNLPILDDNDDIDDLPHQVDFSRDSDDSLPPVKSASADIEFDFDF